MYTQSWMMILRVVGADICTCQSETRHQNVSEWGQVLSPVISNRVLFRSLRS